MFNGRRQPSCGGTSRMTRECQVRFCEARGEIPRAYSAVASHPDVRDAAGMSAMPSIATQSVRRNEASRCAKGGRRQPYDLLSARRRPQLAGLYTVVLLILAIHRT